MMRACRALVTVAVLAMAVPAAAQTTGAGVPAEPIVNSWYLGVNSGTAVVEKFGAVAGLDGGLRVWRNLDVIADLVWVDNAVSRRQVDLINTVADAIGQTQGGGAEGSLRVGVRYGGVGVRWVFEASKIKPYVLMTVGGAHINREPTLTLRGADVTNSTGQYGLTLGQDVIGKYKGSGASAGVGVVMGLGPAYVDLGVRVLSVSEDGTRANVSRLVLGGGYRF